MPRHKLDRPKPYQDMTLDDVRALVRKLHKEGLQIQSHYKRLDKEYSDWEDRLNELDKIISQAEDETGLSKQQIMEPENPFDSLLDEVEESNNFDPLN
jgi:predicted nuclease with TOPRIM domain